MGSTNGTFVNGEKIAGRALLHEGDRILVGTSIIKVVAVEGQLANQSEAEARRRLEAGAQQRQATQGRPMSGVIEEIPLPDLLQLLSTSRKSGVLTVNNGVSMGKIYLRKGALYFATINDDFAVSPQKSIYRMLTWLTGTFELEPSVERESVRIEVTDGASFVPRLVRELTVPVSAVTLSRPSLDDVFLKLTGKAIRDEGAGEMDQMRVMMSRWSRAGGRR